MVSLRNFVTSNMVLVMSQFYMKLEVVQGKLLKYLLLINMFFHEKHL